MIEYNSDAEELEKVMVAVGGDSNPKEGDTAKQKAPPSVMG